LNASVAKVGAAPEMRLLRAATDLEDVLELAAKEPHERITHLTFFAGQVRSSQLDFILVAAKWHSRVDRAATAVHRYTFSEEAQAAGAEVKAGEAEVQLPLSFAERGYLPSDHYPVVSVLRLD
jgi:hypothetical protein